MRRFLPMLRIMFLAVLLWSGNVAHAAEDLECLSPAGAEAVHTADEDHGPVKRDQTPGDSGKAAHQHQGCHGHHFASGVDDAAAVAGLGAAEIMFQRTEPLLTGASPDEALRPPIA